MKKIIFSFILLNIFSFSLTLAQKCYRTDAAFNLEKTTGKPSRTKLNINNISTWVYNNGDADIKPGGNSGFEYPKGSGKYAIFESGLVWGGIIEGERRVGGSTYTQGLLPGRIMSDGTRENNTETHVRIYRVRPDWESGDVTAEIADNEGNEDQIRVQYQLDWNEWPAKYGAPFDDKNSDGNYDPNIDVPGVPGAHQTIWYVANDLDAATCRTLYGSDPMKIELQVTVWGYGNTNSIYDDVMFKKYKIINKNNVPVDTMYISQWTDADLGDAGNDFAGCDTTLNLTYTYNGEDYDDEYGLTVPAVGFQMLQGPIVEGMPTDVAYKNNMEIKGYKNLDITSHYHFICSDPYYNDPDLGEYETGTLQFHNLFRGLVTTYGTPFIDPTTNQETKFTLYGNPITQTGWVDGSETPCGDRRGGFCSGPFTLAPGDTQEVVIASVAAQGTDRLNSVAILKYYASQLQRDYPNLIPNHFPNIREIVPTVKRDNFSEYDIIKLNIERADSIENYSNNGFEFQGYLLYQMPDKTNYKLKGKRIFTYDLDDNTTTIQGETYDPKTGYLINDIIYTGTNSGIPNRIEIDKDYLLDTQLIKGKSYYYGVSAYFYNSITNKVIESSINAIEVIYQGDVEGAAYMDSVESIHTVGSADVNITTEIVNPYELTGDTYELTFGRQNYYLNENGEWIKTNYPDSIGKVLRKPSDISKSRLIPLPSIYAENNTLDIHFQVEVISVDSNLVDGVKIKFPDEIIINSANYVFGNTSGKYISAQVSGQIVTWGVTDSRTTSGNFSGGENLSVNINFVEPTFTVEYEIFDDGWSEFSLNATGDSTFYNLGDGTVDAYGYAILTGEKGYKFKNVPYWNLYNNSQNKIALEGQTIFGEKDYFKTGRDAYVQYGYEPIVDGFRIKLNGTFDSPINFSNAQIESSSGTVFSTNYSYNYFDNSPAIVITNYTVFGGAVSSSAFDNFGVGTTDVNQLRQDYELRFTGVFDQGTTINNKTVYKVKSGGQMATVFRMVSEGALGTHPLNPKYGTAEPFKVRIPFEVWNVEDPDNPYQVNLTFRDRDRDGTENPFWSWNLDNRMYGIIVNSPYDSTQIIQVDEGPDNFNQFATWVLVFKETNYNLNDIIKITYNNPIQFTDKFQFTTPEAPTQKISPNKYEVYQNYPNPFNPNTRIRYFIPEDGLVNLTVFNILGQKVTTLVNKEMKAGKYETEFNGSNFASGVYIYRIDAGNFTETKKMLLLK